MSGVYVWCLCVWCLVSPSVSVSVSVSGVNVPPHLHHAYCVISACMAAPASSMRSFNGAPRLGKLVHVFQYCVVSVAPIDFPVRGMSAHLTLCCVVRVAHLTLMHASWICCAGLRAETQHTRHQTNTEIHKQNHQTETNTRQKQTHRQRHRHQTFVHVFNVGIPNECMLGYMPRTHSIRI
jgi:hypothetical protein